VVGTAEKIETSFWFNTLKDFLILILLVSLETRLKAPTVGGD